MKRESLGIQELSLLRHVGETGAATVRELTDSFGAEHGLSRSTILTMVERLRRKKRLRRSRHEGVYRYETTVPARELLREVVRNFADAALGGATSPFVSYLADQSDLSDQELAELERIVARLQARRGGRK